MARRDSVGRHSFPPHVRPLRRPMRESARVWARDLWFPGMLLVTAVGVLAIVGPWRASLGWTALYASTVGVFSCLCAVGVGPEFRVRQVVFALMGALALAIGSWCGVLWVDGK